MAESQGFLDGLGIGSADEKDILAAQRNSAFGGNAARQRALGQQGASAVGGVLHAVHGLLTGANQGRSVRGVLKNLSAGATNVTDHQAAAASGITVEQMRGRRRMRALSEGNSAGDAPARRIRLLRQIIQIANRSGDTEVMASALAQIQVIKVEELEFEKLQEEVNQSRIETLDDEDNLREEQEVKAFYNGKAVLGIRLPGPLKERGLQLPDVAEFVPWGVNLTKHDPDAGKEGESLDKTYRNVWNSKERSAIRDKVMIAKTTLRKIARPLEQLVEAVKRGTAASILGGAGKAEPWGVEGFRTMRTIVSDTFNVLTGKDKRREVNTKEAIERWKSGDYTLTNGGDIENPLANLKLPDWVVEQTASAQIYRANIIDLAYILARMREPSNRGLSDNDIKLAMAALVTDSNDPEAILRRFGELIFDNYQDLFNQLEVLPKMVHHPESTPQKIWDYFGANPSALKAEMTSIMKRFGYTFTEFGSAATTIFGETPMIGLATDAPLSNTDLGSNVVNLNLPVSRTLSLDDVLVETPELLTPSTDLELSEFFDTFGDPVSNK